MVVVIIIIIKVKEIKLKTKYNRRNNQIQSWVRCTLSNQKTKWNKKKEVKFFLPGHKLKVWLVYSL